MRRVTGSPELRALMRLFPRGVAVLTVDADGQRLGLTLSSLVSLSLEPPLVGFAVSRQAAMHELLREAGSFAVSLLGQGQEALAQHFARGVPPIALWHGVELVEERDGPPLLAGALGWLEGTVEQQVPVGTHTFFLGAVGRVELGNARPGLVRVRGEWSSA